MEINIQDVNGELHKVDLDKVSDGMLKTVKFTETFGRTFTLIDNELHDAQFHLTDIIKAVTGMKNETFVYERIIDESLKLLSNVFVVLRKAEDIGYQANDKNGYQDKNPLEKVIANVKHWYASHQREKHFDKLEKFIANEAGSKKIGDAEYNLGLCYLKGLGVKVDMYKARRYLNLAFAKGNPDAGYDLHKLGGDIDKNTLLSLANQGCKRAITEYLKTPQGEQDLNPEDSKLIAGWKSKGFFISKDD